MLGSVSDTNMSFQRFAIKSHSILNSDAWSPNYINRLKNGKPFSIIEMRVKIISKGTILNIKLVKIYSYTMLNFKVDFQIQNSLEKYEKLPLISIVEWCLERRTLSCFQFFYSVVVCCIFC